MSSREEATEPPIQTRSCHECSRRKVRCDRHQPCRHCTRTGAECVYPRFRRRPVKRPAFSGYQPDTESSTGPNGSQAGGLSQQPSRSARPAEPHWLIGDQRRSRYIGNTFWANMSRDIAEWRDVLDESSASQGSNADVDENNNEIYPDRLASIPGVDCPSGDEHDVYRASDHGSSLGSRMRSEGDSFVFRPFSTAAHALRALYPTETQLLTIWDIFIESVDPVAKIFHRDTIRATVLDPLRSSQQLDRVGEVVMFSVFFAALTSLRTYDCQRLFRQSQETLIARYRIAVEQSLARARFLQSQDLNVLSALVLFLLCVRRHDNSRFVSSMLGIAIRNAQAMGMHRDGTTFHLSPFQTEMRRRVWWHISVLDLRCSEDHGVDPTILDCSHDTKFPSNVNERDLSIDMVATPTAQDGLSDMTFCLVRFEVCVAIRKLHYHDPLHRHENLQSQLNPSKYDLVAGIEKHLHETYIDKCDVTQPVHWVSATWVKMLLAKMWLTVHASHASAEGETIDGQNGSWQLAFARAIELLELSNLLETSPRASRWQWLFLTHTQWHAVVFILAFLCQHPQHVQSTQAWDLVQTTYARWVSSSSSKKGMLWKPLHHLLRKAAQARKDNDSQMPSTDSAPSVASQEFMPAMGNDLPTPGGPQNSNSQLPDMPISTSSADNDRTSLNASASDAHDPNDELNNWLQWDWGDPQLDLSMGDDGNLPEIADKDPSQVLTDMFGPNFRPRYV